MQKAIKIGIFKKTNKIHKTVKTTRIMALRYPNTISVSAPLQENPTAIMTTSLPS